ncbi:MAG: AMP-binding protein, partial [Candidatus Methylomirabilales bacterium]
MMRERPWLASYPAGVPQSVAPFHQRSVYSLLAESASRFPDRPALTFFGRRLTYRQLAHDVEQMSGALAHLGVRNGDRLGLILPNCPQYVIAFYAAQRLGAIPVGTNPLYTERELSHQATDAGIEVVVVLDQLARKVEAVRRHVGLKTVVVAKVTDYMPFPINVLAPIKFKKEAKHEGRPWPPVPEGAQVIWWADLMNGSYPGAPVATVDPVEDVAALVYTGGTTGLSKGAMLTHFNLVTNVRQTAAWLPDLKEGGEAMMCVVPFFHSYGLQVAMNLGILMAMKLILLPRFDLHMVLKAIAKEKVTLFPGVPRIYVAINESPLAAKFDLSSIRACISGAAPLPPAVAEKFEALTGGSLVEGYGLTETSPVTHANPIQGKRKAGSIGLPIPDTNCRLVGIDDPGMEAEAGREGELVIAGPQVMKGYWNRP